MSIRFLVLLAMLISMASCSSPSQNENATAETFSAVEVLQTGRFLLSVYDDKQKVACIKDKRNAELYLRTIRPLIEQKRDEIIQSIRLGEITVSQCEELCLCKELMLIEEDTDAPLFKRSERKRLRRLAKAEADGACVSQIARGFCESVLHSYIQREKSQFDVPSEE